MRHVGKRLYVFSEDYLRIEYILYAFWAMFWSLNGLDKFFNGTLVAGPAGPRLVGWFGVNRDAKFIEYFSRLHLPSEMALSFLYGFAVLEILVGGAFLVLLYRNAPRFLNRLAFKASMLIFFAFSVGDILFGDRQELWEHGTFMVLTLMTYLLYLGRAHERAEVVVSRERFSAVDLDRDQLIDTGEYAAFLERRRESALLRKDEPGAQR